MAKGSGAKIRALASINFTADTGLYKQEVFTRKFTFTCWLQTTFVAAFLCDFYPNFPKMPTTSQQSDEFQQFLDQNQYSSNSILRYEKIFGRGFVSTGGLETTEVRKIRRYK